MMKQKHMLLIFIFCLITILGACQKETATKKVIANVTNIPQTENISEVSGDPTEIPDAASTPIITPSPESEDKSEVDNGPILMPAPPFSYYIADNAIIKEISPIKLKMISSEPNKITDIKDWFANNHLSLTSGKENAESSSEGADTTPTVFEDGNYLYEIEEADNILNIYDAASNNLLYSLDFSNYIESPEYKEEDYDFVQQKIKWAAIKDDILYVSHSHNTYAESSNNMNAYITAINLEDRSILWRSDALVCNSVNFLIIDDVIISGYGFTAEPDYLYQINRYTGKVLDKILLKTAPEYLIEKTSVLYVRTYNTDYQFTVQ